MIHFEVGCKCRRVKNICNVFSKHLPLHKQSVKCIQYKQDKNLPNKTLKRVLSNGSEFLVVYHTQEYRENNSLKEPIKCVMDNAWLGHGYYFWTDLEFAKYWGEDFKLHKNGFYTIYIAHVDTSSCLNAVFDEQHYFFFRNCIEKAVNHFKDNGIEITLKQVHEFLLDRFWKELGITGILYDDLPFNPKNRPNRKYSVIEYHENNRMKHFYYKKRIQLVMFDLKNIHRFDCLFDKQS